MKTSGFAAPRRVVALAVFSALLVAACGKDSPESHIAAGKGHAGKGDLNAAVIEYKNALQKAPQNGEARFLLGSALLEQGNPVGAESELRRAVDAKYPIDAAAPLIARALLEAGEQRKLVGEFSSARLSTPQAEADVKAYVGLAYLQLGNQAAAEAAFGEAQRAMAGHAASRIGAARLAATRGDVAAASRMVDEVLAKEPDSREALQFKGDLATARGDFASASQAFGRVVQLAPKTASAWFSLVIALAEQNKIDEAKKQLEAFRKAVPNDARANYLNAWMTFREGKKDAAKDAIAQVLKVAPDNVPTLALAGMIEADAGNLVQAEAHLGKVLERVPNHLIAGQTLVQVYVRLRQPQKALARLEPLLRAYPTNGQVLALAGEVYLANGRVNEARRYLEQAAAVNTKDPNAQLRLGQLYFAMREDEKATHALQAAASIDPKSDRPELVAIGASMQRREFDKAIAMIDALEKKGGSSAIAANLRGAAYMGKGDRLKARESFEKAFAADPTFFGAAMSLAQLDLRDGKREQARQRFERVVEKDPKNTRAAAMLADFMIAEGKPGKDVVAVLERSIKANPTAPEAHAILVAYYLRTKDPRQAVTAAQNGVAALPDNVQLVEVLGSAQQAAGETQQALATFEKLQKLAPNSPAPLVRLGGAQAAAKDYAGAIRSLERALEFDSANMDVSRQLAAVHLQSGSLENAVKQAKLAQARKPRVPAGYLLEGDIYATQKRWSEADQAYEAGLKSIPSAAFLIRRVQTADLAGQTTKGDSLATEWLAAHPKDVVIRTFLGERAMKSKDFKTAMTYYQSALKMQPDNAMLLNNVAWTSGKSGDPKALEYAARAVDLAPEAPAVLDTYGVLLVERGQTERGIEVLHKAVQLAPAMAELRKNLGTALAKSGKKAEAKAELETALKLPDAANIKEEIEAALKSL